MMIAQIELKLKMVKWHTFAIPVCARLLAGTINVFWYSDNRDTRRESFCKCACAHYHIFHSIKIDQMGFAWPQLFGVSGLLLLDNVRILRKYELR